MLSLSRLLVLAAALGSARGAYNLVEEYAGSSFFAGWDYYGNYDNLTSGDVVWVNQSTATQGELTYVNAAGNAVLKVDNTSDVLYNDKRNSVRLQSQMAYPVGSLWIIDLVHLPYGCSVWPAFWTAGTNWPANGEIDIIEGINLVTANQMALHTENGCTKTAVAAQTGTDGLTNCSTPSGCLVTETQPASYGAAFAAAGGGVWATQFDVSGIYIWFWSRPNVPANVNRSYTPGIDISTWGNPSAAYPPASCDIGNFFGEQYLILDITLCGTWAGVPSIYNQTCLNHGTTGVCYTDNVIGPGSPEYDNAYFEIAYVRAFTLPGTVLPNTTSTGVPPPASTGSAGASSTGAGAGSSGATSRPGGRWAEGVLGWGVVGVLVVVAGLVTL